MRAVLLQNFDCGGPAIPCKRRCEVESSLLCVLTTGVGTYVKDTSTFLSRGEGEYERHEETHFLKGRLKSVWQTYFMAVDYLFVWQDGEVENEGWKKAPS